MARKALSDVGLLHEEKNRCLCPIPHSASLNHTFSGAQSIIMICL